jgi:hypothetical protein
LEGPEDDELEALLHAAVANAPSKRDRRLVIEPPTARDKRPFHPEHAVDDR